MHSSLTYGRQSERRTTRPYQSSLPNGQDHPASPSSHNTARNPPESPTRQDSPTRSHSLSDASGGDRSIGTCMLCLTPRAIASPVDSETTELDDSEGVRLRIDTRPLVRSERKGSPRHTFDLVLVPDRASRAMPQRTLHIMRRDTLIGQRPLVGRALWISSTPPGLM